MRLLQSSAVIANGGAEGTCTPVQSSDRQAFYMFSDKLRFWVRGFTAALAHTIANDVLYRYLTRPIDVLRLNDTALRLSGIAGAAPPQLSSES